VEQLVVLEPLEQMQVQPTQAGAAEEVAVVVAQTVAQEVLEDFQAVVVVVAREVSTAELAAPVARVEFS
jgi:hypothetical protein